MLRRLSKYGLGVFMPHLHDEQTGAFHPLLNELMQVEPGLEVSFRPMEEVANQADRAISLRDGIGAPVRRRLWRGM